MKNDTHYVAHISEDGRIQSVQEHLRNTAELSKEFAASFAGHEIAEQIGLLHDLGKYSHEFQMRILHDGPKVDHSTAGGIEAANLNKGTGKMMAYGIMGHHGGLPDGGHLADISDESTLSGRLKRTAGKEICCYDSYKQEHLPLKAVSPPQIKPRADQKHQGFPISFYIRMLFSCLVDADCLDTEQFMLGENPRRYAYNSMQELLEKFNTYISAWWNPIKEINKKRCEILQSCIEAGKGEKGIYTLTVPTGGGKTVASLGFALNHAVQNPQKMSRIIYVIPYTNIIEQNAKVFGDILGNDNVLEHHSNISYDRKPDGGNGETDEDDKDPSYLQKQLATENWDAPIVVTTNVQFFESLFSSRKGNCRKLHNIVNSIIIFDEAQMLPLDYLKPCMDAIIELVHNYSCTAVLCTATQPSLNKFIPDQLGCREICQNTQDLFDYFRRTTIKNIGLIMDDELTERVISAEQVLCIVNSRKQARNIFESLREEAGVFHLTTYMTPVHRKYVLNTVRKRLSNGETCRLIATSLVEAGVDVDFPTVYRARAGLDSIIQAAGRANREGERAADESMVYVFDTEEGYEANYPTFIKTAIGIECEVENNNMDISSPEAIRDYFERLHGISENVTDKKQLLDMLGKDWKRFNFPFRKLDAEFKMIDQNTKTLFIPYSITGAGMQGEPEKLEMRLRGEERNIFLIRKISQFSVNIYENQLESLLRTGQVEMLDKEIAVLKDKKLYDDGVGLHITIEEGKGLFM